MKRTILSLALLAALSACGPSSKLTKARGVPDTIDQNPDKRGYIEAIGIGASDPALPSETQRRSLSRDAAIIKAQYELLSLVKGVEIEGGMTIARAIEKDSDLRSRVHATIRGAELLKSEFTADNGCVVTMRLPKRRLKELMGVAQW